MFLFLRDRIQEAKKYNLIFFLFNKNVRKLYEKVALLLTTVFPLLFQ